MSASSRIRPHIPAFLLFVALAAVLVGRSLFEGGKQICATDAPDTWIHMWAFWRAKYAIFGHDHSYLLSHTLTYPGIVREPIAIFDPLLPLISIPIQLLFNSCSIAFNWLVFFGLLFTGMAGYILGLEYGLRRTAAFLVGVIIAANPFIYRLLAGGYTEYAWWGLLPLTIALYHKSLRSPSRWVTGSYLAVLTAMLLMSIYCASYFVFFALASLLLNILHALRRSTFTRLKRLLKVQSLALLCLAPLLLLWIHALSLLAWKNIEWPRPFPIEAARNFSDLQLHNSNTLDNRLPAIDESDATDTAPETEIKDWLAWRTLMGALDLAELSDLTCAWKQKHPEHLMESTNGPPQTEDQALVYLDESVFAREWLFVLLLAAIALRPNQRQRHESTSYALLAIAFVILALGPFPLWNGRIINEMKLPYAWMYHWVPGFTRFVIPARAFLGTIFCLAILAGRGAETISDGIARHVRRIPQTAIELLITALLLWGFVATGYQGLSLPQTASRVPSIYKTIRAEPEPFALLDLPTGGPSSRRMYYQSVHEKPVYGGLVAEEWTEENGADKVRENPIVLAMEHPASTQNDVERLRNTTAALTRQGFRYLILHRDGYYQESDHAAATTLADALFGSPAFKDETITVYTLRSSTE